MGFTSENKLNFVYLIYFSEHLKVEEDQFGTLIFCHKRCETYRQGFVIYTHVCSSVYLTNQNFFPLNVLSIYQFLGLPLSHAHLPNQRGSDHKVS
jgi:hypothetical protein